MERVAIFPGSFDPFTVGHQSIVERALPLFDKIVIAIGYNAEKRQFFLLRSVFSGLRKPSITIHELRLRSTVV